MAEKNHWYNRYSGVFIPLGMVSGLGVSCFFNRNDRGPLGLATGLLGFFIGWIVGVTVAVILGKHPLHWNGEI
jgi:hypothetical protein